VAILKILIQSLEALVSTITNIASFIKLLESDLTEISQTAVGQQLKKRHWKIMTGKAKHVVACCRAFIAVEPAITSDLRSIRERLDQDDVNNWKAGLKQIEMS